MQVDPVITEILAKSFAKINIKIREDSSYKKKSTNFFTKQSEPRVYLKKKSVSYINIRRPEMTDKEKRIRSLIANRSVISLDDIDGAFLLITTARFAL